MNLEETPEQSALRQELRTYFAELLPPEKRRVAGEQGVGGEHFREIVRLLGKDGWLGIGWPVEFGGQGRSAEDQFVFFDEVQRAGLPFPFVTVNTVGPTLMKFGTEEQKERFLPGILAGEIVFAIGYTEPEAGTDLASLRTKAVRDGEDWVVNGNKIFTSGANTADYVWLAARTDPEAPKHRGISILIVPTDDEGFSWSPINTVGGLMVTSTYYSDIRITDSEVVGEVNGGWQLITAQLNHERIGLAALGGRTLGLWRQVFDWARDNGALEIPWVRIEFARTHAKLGTETHIEVYRALQGILGAVGRLRPGSPGAVLGGQIEQISRQSVVNTFGGGVNEVLRDMVGTMGLGLVRAKRNA